MMQDQSSKARKGPVLNDFPTFISETQDSKDTNNSKTTKFSTMDSLLNDFPLCAPSHEMELDEEVETVSWLNFPIVEPFNDEYCSELLPVLGVAGNETDSASMQRRSNSHHVDELPRPSTAASTPSMQQHSISKVLSSVTEQNKLYIGGTSPLMQNQYPFPRRGKSEFTHSDASNANRIPSPVGGSMGSKQHKLDAGQPSNRSAVNNFPYISRLASLSGVNVWNTATAACDVTGGKQRACDKNRGGTINSCNAMEPTLVNSSHQEVVSHGKLSMPPTAGSIESVTSKSDSLPPQQSEALCVKAGKNGKSIDQPLDAVPTEVMTGDERIREPVVATSSICSGNRIERASSDPACSLKRKCRETEDSEGPSDEAEEESVGDRIFSGRTGSKRGRAAEVHNLSERKRRERINEKMRALQELIPNCNKADKASMLDVAIEYMKTLQLQLQILSMGTGMYMPPMMLPSAMQQMHRAQMPQFLPMGIGMGMHDVNYSMTHMPNMQGPCYPVPGPPLSSPATFPRAVGYSHHFLGHPGQELLMSMPHIPPPLFGIPPTRLPVGNVSAMTGTLNLSHLAPTAGSKEMIQSVSSQKILNDQEKSNE